MKNRAFGFSIAGLIFLFDQLTKWIVTGPLRLAEVQQRAAQAGGDQRECEHASDGRAVRLEPAEILADVLAPLAATVRRNVRRRPVPDWRRLVGRIVETAMLVILDEAAIPLARGAWVAHAINVSSEPSLGNALFRQ